MAFLGVNDGEIEDLLQELDESDPAKNDAYRFAKEKKNIGRDHTLQRWNRYVQERMPLGSCLTNGSQLLET